MYAGFYNKSVWGGGVGGGWGVFPGCLEPAFIIEEKKKGFSQRSILQPP